MFYFVLLFYFLLIFFSDKTIKQNRFFTYSFLTWKNWQNTRILVIYVFWWVNAVNSYKIIYKDLKGGGGLIGLTCLNPVVRLREDFYNLLLLQSNIKFKNFLLLDQYNIEQQNLIKNLYALGYVDYYKCNKCIACLHIKKRDWFKRCLNESTNWKNCYFITLTFDNEHYNQHNKKRLLSYWLRDHLKKYLGKNNYKYFAVSEHGSITNRFHYHMLLFTNLFFTDLEAIHYSKKHNLQYCSQWFNYNWRYGFHTIDLVHSLAAFKYCVKYTTKSQQLKVYCSRGFGNYIKNFDAVNYEDLPRSILTNAYSRLWNANRRFKRHEITKEQLDYVFKQNEPYNALKTRYKEYWRLHAVNKFTNTKQLSTAYVTKYLHTINTKLQL